MGVFRRAQFCLRRNGGDLLLPVVQHARHGRRLAALGPEPPQAAERSLLALLSRPAGRTRATTRQSSTSRWRRSLPPASTRSCRPGGAAAPRGHEARDGHCGGAQAPAPAGDPPRAVPGPLAETVSSTSSTSRRSGCATSTSTTRATLPPPTGRRSVRRCRHRFASSPARNSSASRRRGTSTASNCTTS